MKKRLVGSLILACGVVLAAGLENGFATSPNQGTPTHPGVSIASPDWEQDIQAMLDEILRVLNQTKCQIGDRIGEQLSDAERAAIDADLCAVINLIAVAFQPASSSDPGLSTYGAIDYSVSPQTLPQYAAICEALASNAAAPTGPGTSFDRDYVADQLRTLQWLLTREAPSNYRSKLNGS